MRKFVHVIISAVLAIGWVAVASPASAQVSLDIGERGPRVQIGPQNDRRYRGESRRGYDGRAQGECREVTTRSRRPDGSTMVRTSRRCD